MAASKVNVAAAVEAGKASVESSPKKGSAKTTTKKKVTKKKKVTTRKVNPSMALTLKAIDKHTKGTVKPIKLSKAPLPCVSSGSMAIDNLIGGNPSADGTGPICMGFPRGHISEVYGPEASGKTTIALEAIADIQRKGGTAMFLDFEHALHHGYASKLGVDFDENCFAHIQPENMEQGMEFLRFGAAAGVDIIVVDSVAAMVPKSDMEKKFTDGDQIGSRARALASLLPRIVKVLHAPSKHNPQKTAVIFINQTRASISTGPGGGSGDNTSGGKALKFFAYLRLMATRIGSEYLEIKDPLTKEKRRAPFGNKTIVKVIKSKVDAKQGHTCNIFIRFGQGIDDYYSMIESGVAHKIVKKSGAFFEFEAQKFQGREKFRKFLMADQKAFKTLRNAVLKSIRAQAQDMEPEEDVPDDVDELLATTLGEDDYPEAVETPEETVLDDEDISPDDDDDDDDEGA